MGYAILRVEKLKGAGKVVAALEHSTRERETTNADPEKRSENGFPVNRHSKNALAQWRDRLETVKRKIRPDAVTLIEYVINRSPDHKFSNARQEEDYLRDAVAWVIARHGEMNVIHAGIHRDETTPAHVHVFAVPIRNTPRGPSLCAAHWLDGSKKLSQMQTDFWQKVGKYAGLDRGIIGSKARHDRVKRFYGAITTPDEVGAPKVPPVQHNKKCKDPQTEIDQAVRLTENAYKPILERLNEELRYRRLIEKEKKDLKRTLGEQGDQTHKLVRKFQDQVIYIEKLKIAVLENGDELKRLRNVFLEQKRKRDLKEQTPERSRGRGEMER